MIFLTVTKCDSHHRRRVAFNWTIPPTLLLGGQKAAGRRSLEAAQIPGYGDRGSLL